MTVTITPVKVGLFDGDTEPATTDGARDAFIKINENEQNLKTAVDAGSGGGAFEADGDTQITPSTPIVLGAASGEQIGVDLSLEVNQSGTAGYDADFLDVTENSTGSGGKHLIRRSIGGVDKFSVTSTGQTHLISINSFAGDASYRIRVAGTNWLTIQGKGGVRFQQNADQTGGNVFEFSRVFSTSEMTASSGEQYFVNFDAAVNQSGTAGYTGIHIDVTEVALGSGENNLLNVKVGGISQAKIDNAGIITANGFRGVVLPIIGAASDETTALTTGAAKLTYRMPFAFTLTAVRASVSTAPTGSVLTVDINESGSTILSTKITIDATEKTSETAVTPPVISDAALADDSEITIDIDQIGSSVAGTGLKVYLIGTQA